MALAGRHAPAEQVKGRAPSAELQGFVWAAPYDMQGPLLQVQNCAHTL